METGEKKANTEHNVQQAVVMLESRRTNATIKCGDKTKEITFMITPEVPSMSAASALIEVRKVLKQLLKPGAIAKVADKAIGMFEGSSSMSMKDVLKGVMPFLQADALQNELYGHSLEVSGSSYVEDTLVKELRGISVHIAVLIEALKEDPMVLAKVLPLMVSDKEEKKGESQSNKKDGDNVVYI